MPSEKEFLRQRECINSLSHKFDEPLLSYARVLHQFSWYILITKPRVETPATIIEKNEAILVGKACQGLNVIDTRCDKAMRKHESLPCIILFPNDESSHLEWLSTHLNFSVCAHCLVLRKATQGKDFFFECLHACKLLLKRWRLAQSHTFVLLFKNYTPS